jgi:hypothetical protein
MKVNAVEGIPCTSCGLGSMATGTWLSWMAVASVLGVIFLGTLGLRRGEARRNPRRRALPPTARMVQDKARKFVRGLSRRELGELGDALVSGEFDWRDWLPSKPSGALLHAIDEERILAEQED